MTLIKALISPTGQRHSIRMRTFATGTLATVMLGFVTLVPAAGAQAKRPWRAASPAELEAHLPARATVEKERIETEMRTATGIIDDHDNVVAAVVLVTAGYSADGKYSHFLLAQHPIRIGRDLLLAPGSYVVGWTRAGEGLLVRIFDAKTGVEKGQVTARALPPPQRVESFRIFPPGDRKIIQIGRFMMPYSLDE